MKSSFKPDQQNAQLESNIVVALERISEAFRVLLWNESKENSLSPIQTQVLIFLLFHAEEMCKVSYLAQEFNMTKATMSDSIKMLLTKKLVQKVDDPIDTRSFRLKLTSKGKATAEQSASFAHAIEKPIHQLTESQRRVVLQSLLSMIRDLQKAGIISAQRMCFSCSHYEDRKGTHYCKLLQSKLQPEAIRIDCAEHEPAA